MYRFTKLAVASIITFGTISGAQAATPIDFSGSASVTANAADPGLLVNVLNVVPFSFSLTDVGSTASISSLFTLWTPEADVGSDDKIARTISVGFDLTPGVTGTATGTTIGQTSGWFGAVQNGRLSWNQNEFQLAFGDGGLLGVSLTGGIFNTGLFGLGHLPGEGLEVGATFRLISPSTPIRAPDAIAAAPEPATWATMLLGFGAIGYSLRRRTTQRVSYSA
jgi:hypothetical protein